MEIYFLHFFFIHFTVLLLMLHKCLLSTWIIICKCGLTVYSLSLPEGGAVHPVFVSFPSVLSFRGQLMTGQKTDYIDFFSCFLIHKQPDQQINNTFLLHIYLLLTRPWLQWKSQYYDFHVRVCF